ncbi:MAG: hypothetical protein KDB10_19490 [Acidimicrobiales bacterium]|nr:hypothetical protein [Acidimicrobiales bacterium]MCB9371209.1 hypothetical protein [Microthrixaceae bacterium]
MAPDKKDDLQAPTEDEDLLDQARGTGVGTEDPNIVGDAGPVDVPPGHGPDGDLLVDDPDGAEQAEI